MNSSVGVIDSFVPSCLSVWTEEEQYCDVADHSLFDQEKYKEVKYNATLCAVNRFLGDDLD